MKWLWTILWIFSFFNLSSQAFLGVFFGISVGFIIYWLIKETEYKWILSIKKEDIQHNIRIGESVLEAITTSLSCIYGIIHILIFATCLIFYAVWIFFCLPFSPCPLWPAIATVCLFITGCIEPRFRWPRWPRILTH